jgi:tetratricopeptide (TPR) repeat protein
MYFLAVDTLPNAQAAFDAGRLAEARVLLETLPADAPAQALLARVYWASQLPQKAALSARAAERLAPANPQVQHTLALYYAQSGQRKLAALWEGRFADSNEADPAAPLRAAFLNAETAQWPEAIRHGQRALTQSDRPDLRSLLARAYEATNQPGKAIENYQALVKLQPYDEPAHAAYGQALLRMARFNDAANFLADARTKFDKSPQIELAYGVALYTQRRFQEAGVTFLRVIELAPEVPQPYIFLARMIDQLPEKVGEIKTRAEAWLRIEPKNGFAPFVVARAGATDAEAKPLLLEAIRRDPTVWEFQFELGQLLERARDWASAATAYEKAVALNPKVPEPHYRLARAYDRLNQPAKAARERALHEKLQAQPKGGMQ